MKKYTEEELKGKFVIAFDTIVDGNQCVMEGEEGNEDYGPALFDSEDEAFKELFGDAVAKWESIEMDGELDERLEEIGATKEDFDEMNEIWDSGDVNKMKKFFDDNPDFNDFDEWVEPADEFIMNRKTMFGEKGIVITGTKLSD